MDKDKQDFNFWYAVENTKILKLPNTHLETFGSTIVNYYLVSELMDSANKIRVREGRLEASRPKLIMPSAYSQTMLEGFGKEAEQYINWLKENEQKLRILEYGYSLTQQAHREYVIEDNLQSAVDKVEAEVKAADDPMSAIAVGVDEPWDVCLVKLFWEVMQQSVGPNIQELHRYKLLDNDQGVPLGLRQDIEEAFRDATLNPDAMKALASLLQKNNLFDEYQDRFFALAKKHQNS